MSKEMTVKEMASMGGKARAKSMSRQRRVAIARNAINTRWRNHKARIAKDNKGKEQTTK